MARGVSVGWGIVFDMSIEGMLRRQVGAISRRQALAAGMSRTAVVARITAGRWRPVHPGVYLAHAHDWTVETWVWAAMLWAGPAATLSGMAAAWWHGLLAERPGLVEVTVPRRQRLGLRPNVLVRRRDLHPADQQQRRGLMVTSPALTVLEAAVALGYQGGPLLDRALQRTVGFDAVLEAHHRNLGRYGSVSGGTLLVAAADRASSAAERLVIKLFRDARLTGWECGVQVGPYVLDFAFREQRVAVEVDGWAWHSDVERFRADRQRQNHVVLADWLVLRYTWHDLTQRPTEVISEIRAALIGRQAA
jgi:very-short-patch-repair endonuclease